MSKRRQRGFTLIELLVVIAIIGLLASIVLVSLNSARAKARDSKAQGDLRQIAIAMEMYYDTSSNYFDTTFTAAGNAVPASAAISTYLSPVPRHNGDPTGGTYYWYNPVSTQRFCAYAQSDATTTNYFYVSESGSGIRTAAGCP